MFGGRQFATYDQGWIGWITQKAIEIKNNTANEAFTISGNGKQVRDLLYASDCVALYLQAASNIDTVKGQAFNIGGGIQNSYSLIELFQFLEKELETSIIYQKLSKRASDQRVFVSDNNKILSAVDSKPKVDKEDGKKRIINWLS